MTAAISYFNKDIIDLVLDVGAAKTINIKSDAGKTALYIASISRYIDMVESLLKA